MYVGWHTRHVYILCVKKQGQRFFLLQHRPRANARFIVYVLTGTTTSEIAQTIVLTGRVEHDFGRHGAGMF